MEPEYIKLRDIKPALSAYIRKAMILLKSSPVPGEDAVHDIRVLMKKSRAVMKLISSQIDAETFKRDYGSLRDAGRMLSSMRESSVHRKTLKELKKGNQALFSELQTNEKLGVLLQKGEMTEEPSEPIKNDLENIEELLNKTGYRIRFESLNKLDPGVLLKDLEKTYNIVVDKYLICRNKRKPENIHELRKKAKDFLYQLWFFRSLNPVSVKSLEKKLDTITQNLGKYNDLEQLLKALDYKYPGSANYPHMDELALIIREEQDRYLSKIWPVTTKIFSPGQKLVNLLGFRILVL